MGGGGGAGALDFPSRAFRFRVFSTGCGGFGFSCLVLIYFEALGFLAV